MNNPTLTEDRVASMRSSVMHAVDQDIRRRGHRARRAIGLAAASVLVVGIGSAGLSALDSDTSGGADSSSAGSGALTDQAAPEVSRDDASAKSVAPDDGRKVITTGSISVTADRPRDIAQQLSVWVDRIGGRVESRTEDGTGGEASATVVVRVPSGKVTATVAHLKTYGTVETVSLHNDDVTAASKDLDARIDALQLSIGRLQDLLAKADTSQSIISAESALTKRQEGLEQLQAQKRAMDGQVALSTIEIDLAQKPTADSVEPGGFTGGLTDGWNALVSTVNNVVEVAGVLLPWAAILLVLYGAYRLLARRRR